MKDYVHKSDTAFHQLIVWIFHILFCINAMQSVMPSICQVSVIFFFCNINFAATVGWLLSSYPVSMQIQQCECKYNEEKTREQKMLIKTTWFMEY